MAIVAGLVRIDHAKRALWTDTRAVARVFRRRHDNVLRDVDRLECSPEFRLLNFEETSTLVKMPNGGTREHRDVRMNEWGFVFLVMGFTGKEAATFKEAFIAEFRRMSELLRQPALSAGPPSIDMTGAVTLRDGKPTTTSQTVARLFGKRHPSVLRTIDGLRVRSAEMMREGDPVAARFHLDNFEETKSVLEVNNGALREERGFFITEAGFMAMGFTGPAAMRLKILFIEEFRQMRDTLAHAPARPESRVQPAEDLQTRRYWGYRGTDEEWRELCLAWDRAFGDRRVRTADIQALAESNRLFEALMARSSTSRGRVTSFGMALKKRIGVDCGGFLIERMAHSDGHSTFRLQRSERSAASRTRLSLPSRA